MRISLSGLGDPVRKNGSQHFYNCIFCDDTSGHLGVHIKKGIFHCFKCNASGRLDSLPALDRFTETVKSRLEGTKQLEAKIVSEHLELPDGFREGIHKDSLAYRYIRARDISEEEIDKFRIGYCVKGFFEHRIIVPIYENKRLRYFVGRTYVGGNPRYMNSPVPKQGIVFKTFKGRVDTAVICEGIFDALRIGKLYPAIALLGKVLNGSKQLESIKEAAEKVIIMLDSDAKVDAMKLYQALSPYLRCRIVFINKKDPGELSLAELNNVVRGKL
jgi:DNA primase